MNKTLLLLFFLALACTLSAQNTIGGVRKEVPEAELERQSRFLDAESARMLGKHDKAVDLYRKFLYDNQTNGAGWYGLSRSLTAQKDYPGAIDAIVKAVENDPENKWYQLHHADLLELGGNVKGAIKVYENLTKKFPNTPEFFEKLAYLAVLNGDPKGGLKALDRLEQLTGVTEQSATKKHLIYVGLNDNKRAAEALSRLAEAYPAQIDYRCQLARFYAEIGDQTAAVKTWETVLRLSPGHPEAQLALLGGKKQEKNGDAAYLQSLKPVFSDRQMSIDQKIQELLPYLQKLENNPDPATVQALTELGQLLENTHGDDPKAWSVSGDIFYLSDRPDEALVRYEKCLALKGNVFPVYHNALAILIEKGRYPDAMSLAEKAIDDFPNQPAAYLAYADAALGARQPDSALPQLLMAQRMAGANATLRLDVAARIAQAHLLKRDVDTAISILEKQSAVPGAEKHPFLLETWGDAWLAKGDRNKATEYWKKAYSLQPTTVLKGKLGN